jgi:TP901 family phage tail tape measure protein
MANTTREMTIILEGKVKSSLTGAMAKTAKQLQTVHDKTKQIGQKKAEIDKFRLAMEKAGHSTEGLAKDTERLERELQQADRQADKLVKTFDRLQREDKRIEGLTNAVARNREATGQARGQLLDAAAMAVALAAPVKKAMEFENAMADVRKVVDGLDDPKQFQAMGKAIMELTTKGGIPMAADGLAQIVASGGQAGIARGELLAFARDAAKMGVAFDITAEESGDLMASWRTAFRMNQKEVRTLADKINYLGNTTAASAPKISDAVTRIGALGEVGGLQSGEIAALASSMIAMGTAPEVAATGIKKIITTLNTGTSETKRQAAAFDRLGLDSGELAKRMQKEAGPAITDVMRRLSKLPKYEQTSVLKDLFGAESLAGIGSLLPNLETVEENLRKVGDASKYTGSMQLEFESRSKTASNALQLLQNEATRGGVAFGSILLPEIVKTSEEVRPLMDKFMQWAEKNPKLVGSLVKIGSALVAARVLMLAGKYAALIVKGGILDMGLAALKAARYLKITAAAQKLLNLVMAKNPYVLAAIALIAVGTAVYWVVKNWDKVKAAMSKAWNWFVKFSTEGPGKFVPLFAAIGWIVKNWDKVKAAGVAAWDAIKNAISRAWESIKKVWDFMKKLTPGSVANTIVSAVKGRGKVAKHAAGGIVNRPTLSWIGEQGTEAVIPLQNNRRRALSLYGAVGQQLGVAGAGGGSISVSFGDIIINGNANRADIESGLAGLENRIVRTLKKLQSDQRRRAMD